MGGEGYLDIILLALVAGFILLRLRSVLGRRTGFEQTRRPPEPAPAKAAKPAEDNVIPLPERNRSEPVFDAPPPTSPTSIGLEQIQRADRSFNPAEFVTGAKAAYDLIVTAFAAGDTATLGRVREAKRTGDSARTAQCALESRLKSAASPDESAALEAERAMMVCSRREFARQVEDLDALVSAAGKKTP